MSSSLVTALLCSLLQTPQTTGLTAPPGVLGVSQSPARLTVMRGETVSLSCRSKVRALSFQWFRMKQRITPSPRHILLEKSQNASLLITEAAPKDSGKYYCEVTAMYKNSEWGNGTELTVLAPPSKPRLYLRASDDPLVEHFSLVCVTWGFSPSNLSLIWTNQSAASPIDRLPIRECALPSASDPVQTPQCLQMVDLQTSEAYLFSLLPLPDGAGLETGVTYTCSVEGHNVMTGPLNASYTWEAPPNLLMGVLNVFKMCFLSAVTAMFSSEAVKSWFVKRMSPQCALWDPDLNHQWK